MVRILAFILFMLPFTAFANVMTFVGLTGNSISTAPYSEDGILAEVDGYGGLAYHGHSGTAHMDDYGTTPFTDSIAFSMEGRFDAVSFDYIPGSWGYYHVFEDGSIEGAKYLNAELVGERNGSTVATTLFQMNDVDTTYHFGSAFENLDSLTISLLSPLLGDDGEGGEYGSMAPASHWSIDNVTLSAVPLPAALPLFGAALVGLGLLRRFKLVRKH